MSVIWEILSELSCYHAGHMTSGTWIHDRVARFEEKPALGLKDELFGIKD